MFNTTSQTAAFHAAGRSISALRRLIATLGPEQSGKFFNHTGREYPW